MPDNEIVPTSPRSRREVWLEIAIAVANGMPEPDFQLYADNRIGSVDLADAEALKLWAAWLGAHIDELPGHRHVSAGVHANFGGRFGWSWNLSAPAGRPDPTEPEQELAVAFLTAVVLSGNEPFVTSKPYNGFLLQAYYLPDNDTNCRVVLSRDGETVREFIHPTDQIWTLLAQWTEWPEVNPERVLADGVGASMDALAQDGAE